jgi:hypothetical protein
MVRIIPSNGLRLASRFIIIQEFLSGKKDILKAKLKEEGRRCGIFYMAHGVDRFHDLFIFLQLASGKVGHVQKGHIGEASYARH